jgi:arsenite methyltransferase
VGRVARLPSLRTGKVVVMTMQEPSLEALVETGILPGSVFHPGGLEVSRELAVLCGIGATSEVLDVACGTGETACFLAESFGCRVVGIDATELQITRAQEKKGQRNVPVEFHQADAHRLPFPEGRFDAVISEATLCHLDIGQVLKEMTRVARPGGRVGIHDLCWQENAPATIKQRFAEVENERPETLAGWARRFEEAGLVEVRTVDRSQIYPTWVKEEKRRIGLLGQLRIFLAILKRWGLAGCRRIRESQRIWESEHMGYGIIVGSKPITNP